MVNGVTRDEATELALLREEVKKDMALAIANFKIWLLAAILSNVVLIGVPALYVFFSTTSTATTALSIALSNQQRLEGRTEWISRTDQRLQIIERHLQATDSFDPPRPEPLPR